MEPEVVMMASKGELSSGYKLVPWSSWDQWNFVRESIFSSEPESVAAALRRVQAWRSRGCLPVAIDVTAAIVEIQQKDPFFRVGLTHEGLSSEELLSMLYCMAIMRLVNGFVEPSHKKTGCSISELAEVIGIPRVLVDIRHESSHRSLPSLQLVRLAGIKALDWLKSNYWEPQRKAIPDVRKEIRSRLKEMAYYLKSKHMQRLTSHIKGRSAKRTLLQRGCNKFLSQISGRFCSSKAKGCDRQISKISKIISRLYSAYPSEVVSVLMEFFQLHTSEFSDGTENENSEDSDVCNLVPFIVSISDLKMIITKLSCRRPRLLLSILKAVLETIVDRQDKGQDHSLLSHGAHLCSLVPWLLMNLKVLKDSGHIGLMEETHSLSTDTYTLPKVSLGKLLRKCLALSALGSKHLSDSVLLLAEMSGNTPLIKKLQKLPLPGLQDQEASAVAKYHSNNESFLVQEEDHIKKAKEKLESLKLQSKNYNPKNHGTRDKNGDAAKDLWSVAESWIPCPIGMLPCSFSSTAVLPVLDKVDVDGECRNLIRAEINHNVTEKDQNTRNDKQRNTEPISENGNAIKKLKLAPEEERLDSLGMINPMEGMLQIDGVWKQVGEEELLNMQCNIRILVQ